mgnify:CR=1 FL=1
MWLLTLLGLAIVLIVLTTTVLKLHPFLALLLAAFGYGIASDRMSLKEVVDAVNLGFGGTIGSIGIVILAGSIIIITGSGGAFGKILQSSGIGDIITTHLGGSTSLRILLPFAVAAALKTAQGSSTVAIITTAGIMSPLLESLHLGDPTGRALAVISIGAGSMVVSHVNDSYFWVVTGVSKMSMREGCRLQTLGTLVQGCTAAAALWVVGVLIL